MRPVNEGTQYLEENRVMPVKIFEKELFIGTSLLVASVMIFRNTILFSVPVRVSKKGVLTALLATGLLCFALRFISRSIHRQQKHSGFTSVFVEFPFDGALPCVNFIGRTKHNVFVYGISGLLQNSWNW